MNIYLIFNNSIISNLNYEDNDLFGVSREKRPLSVEGENIALKISKLKILQNVDKIYSSTYASSIASAKYLSNELGLSINVTKLVNERKIGILNADLSEFNDLQEHNFNYRLDKGESFNEVKNRALLFLKQIGKVTVNDNIVVFTHDTFIKSLLLNYCHIGYNLNKRLILEYNNKTIMDEKKEKFKIYKLTIENNFVRNIEVVL